MNEKRKPWGQAPRVALYKAPSLLGGLLAPYLFLCLPGKWIQYLETRSHCVILKAEETCLRLERKTSETWFPDDMPRWEYMILFEIWKSFEFLK
jgi:hypothetical protein